MGIYFEALERYTTEKSKGATGGQPGLGGKHFPFTMNPVDPSESWQAFEALTTNFLSAYAGQSVKTILFNGVSPGCGTSTVAASFAAFLAKDTGLKVLLVDANFRDPAIHKIFSMKPESGLLDLLHKAEHKTFEIKKVGSDQLYVLTSGGTCANPLPLLESTRFFRFIEKVRGNLDYVIVDAPQIALYPESKMMCRKMDGVMLVVESGKSRRQVALRIKKDLENAGGRVLGTVLNKRNYHIPNWLYHRI